MAEFYPHNAVFDPVTDKLIDTSPPATPLCKAYPEPYRNPNEAVAQAIDAYRAALAAAQPSEPVRSKPLGTLAPSQPARPGFAVK